MSRTVAIVAVLAFPLVAFAAEPNLKAIEEQIQKVTDAATPSVVSVVVSHSKAYAPVRNAKPGQLGVPDQNDLVVIEPFRPKWNRFQNPPPPSPLDLSVPDNAADHLYGAGVVLDAREGLILTPYHLIEGARKVFVRGSNGKGSYADIHAADAKSDLAVLKLITPSLGLKAVKIAEVRLTPGADGEKPNLKKGSMVIALGHPTAVTVGEGSPSASWGILSNIRLKSAPPPAPSGGNELLRQRPLHQQGGLIQVDARVALGSTGTALFNSDGELVGLGSSVAAVHGSEVNGGYAIPMDANYRRVVGVLKEGKEVEYGFLGVSPADAVGGVRVQGVSPGCPASQAGLQFDDLLTAIDGNPLTSPDDLLLHAGGALAGSEVTVEYERNGGKYKTKLTLAKNVNPLPFIASVTPPAPFGIKIDYFSMRAAGGAWPDRNPPPPPPPGVLVREVEAGSPGERALKEAGQPIKGAWLITHVDGKPVSNPKEYYTQTAGKKSLRLHLADPDQPTVKAEIRLP